MAESKVCGKCKTEKGAGEFAKRTASPDGLQQWCKECNAKNVKDWIKKTPGKRAAMNEAGRAYFKARYATDPEYREKKKRVARAWRQSLDPEEKKAYHRKDWLWKAYRLRPGAFEQAKIDQGGLCACCGKVPDEWIVDHCHETGLVRGLVCRRCNNGLGSLDDSVEGLMKAVAYLEAFNNRNEGP